MTIWLGDGGVVAGRCPGGVGLGRCVWGRRRRTDAAAAALSPGRCLLRLVDEIGNTRTVPAAD